MNSFLFLLCSICTCALYFPEISLILAFSTDYSTYALLILVIVAAKPLVGVCWGLTWMGRVSEEQKMTAQPLEVPIAGSRRCPSPVKEILDRSLSGGGPFDV